MSITPQIRQVIDEVVRGNYQNIELVKSASICWCPCGYTIIECRTFPFDHTCPICMNKKKIAHALLSGAIKSVTQYPEYRRITRNIDERKRGKHICIVCGVTLSGRGHARTCSGKCRVKLSRMNITIEGIV